MNDGMNGIQKQTIVKQRKYRNSAQKMVIISGITRFYFLIARFLTHFDKQRPAIITTPTKEESNTFNIILFNPYNHQ